MGEAKGRAFNWWSVVYGGLGAIAVTLPSLIWGHDTGFFAAIGFVLFAYVALFAVMFAKRRGNGGSLLWTTGIFTVLTFALLRSSDSLRTSARWLFHSQDYKPQVLGQQQPLAGTLKHVEWDAWGWAGVGNTTVYLVFDPSDRLNEAVGRRAPGHVAGIPCEVLRVHRLERNWYTVLFYSDTDWEHCG